MNSNFILIIVLLLIVATNIVMVFFIRKNPAKILGSNLNGDDYKIKIEWVKLLCKMIFVCNIIILIGGIVSIYYSNILLFVVLVSLPIPLGILYAYHKKYKLEKSKLEYKNKLLIAIVSICLLLEFSVFLGVSCQSGGNLNISMNDDDVVIHGLYGTEILYCDIAEINLQSKLPEIKLRSNGFAVGNTRLGNFITQDDEHVKLFTYSDTCIIQIVTKNRDVYYLSRKQPDETQKVFKELKKSVTNEKKLFSSLT